MLSEPDVLDAIAQLFPIEGDGFRLELVDEHPPCWTPEALHATLRLVLLDAGEIRDIKEQTPALLPQAHRSARGLAYLEAAAACIRALRVDELETLMPMDLFAPAILDAPLEPAAFVRTLGDPRARLILERRPGDRALLATIDPAGWRVPVAVNEALERDIALQLAAMPRDVVEAPDAVPIADPGAFGVYGDWLSERGDPRGELVALQVASAAVPDPDLEARAAALIDRHGFEWLGPFAWRAPDQLALAWRHGFLERMSLHEPAAPDLVALRGLPGLAFLQALDLQMRDFGDDRLFAAIGDGLPPSVRHLALATCRYEGTEDELEPAYAGLASLESWRLESRAFDLGSIELPALRSLELVTRGLTRANLGSLYEARWPQLERLVLWIGDEDLEGCDVALDDLAWIFDGARLPALRALGLCGRGDARPLLERLLVAPILPRLEILDLADTGLAVEDLGFLCTHAAKLAHLRRVHVKPPPNAPLAGLPANLVRDDRFVPVYE